MLDNTINVEKHIKSFEKYSPATMENTLNEPQVPNEPSFIPKSARGKLELNYSKALANDTAINDLKRKLEHCKKDLAFKAIMIFRYCAKLELNHYKLDQIKTPKK